MNSKKHAQFTEASASISRKAGGKVTAYDGYIFGTNLEIVPDTKIVQSWSCTDWPEGHFSKAEFVIEKSKGGTKLVFTQTDVPEEFLDEISDGWHEHYWEKMKRMLEKKG